MKLYVSTGNSRMDRKFNGSEMEYADFVNRLSKTTRTAETVEQYRRLPKARQDDIKDVGGFILGRLKGGSRKKDCVLSRGALTLDMDHGTESIVDEIEMFHDMEMVIYSTHKHTPEAPRLRLIIPLTREVTPDEYGAVSRMIASDIGIELFDDTTYEPSRLMYWPSTSSDGVYVFKQISGNMVNPDAVLSRYKNWKDVSSWPVSNRQGEVVKREIRKLADPMTKEGLIGAFNRAYPIREAIETFLSDVYQPSAMQGRYDYVPADSAAGVVVYEDAFVYSHHATDPCCGMLMNAFDAVRLHKFGDKDAKALPGTEPGKLPSFKAMQDFASRDEKVKQVLATERQALAAAEFTDVSDANWQMQLELDRQGKIKDTLLNIAIIIRYDENLQNIVYNEFKDTIDVTGVLPWKQVKPGWNDSDLANAKVYFERVYGIWSPTKFKDALLAVVSSERVYHPIKEYFAPLEWDGVKRIDTLLIDYFGAEDTPYTRAVIRKTLVAAVARIYQPGIKFDFILVLSGPQGLGKSTFFSILGMKWFSDSLSISDMRDKTAAEKLLGNWILEISEMNGIRKTEVEVVKSFVTRQDDKFRQAYGVNVESHPRKCIIVGSTNSESGFLRDVTGNRRFWPVHVPGTGKHHPWELTEVDQIWAEAIHLYNEGEELFLKGAEAEEAYKMQQAAMESDDREGIVEEYLDRLLPANWTDMDIYQRRAFLGDGEFETAGITGTVVRERVCIMEIWCECFGKERQNLRKSDSYEMEAILNKIGGWKKYDANASGKTKVPHYGVQKTFVRAAVTRIVGLTGTPGNLMDLWAEIGILDMGQRLGRFIGGYRDRFFVPDKRNREIIFSYKPREGAEDKIYELISDITISMKAVDYLDMPECIYNRVEVSMSKEEQALYEQLRDDMIIPFGEGEDIDAVNAGALSNKLQQMANGAVYDESGNVRLIHDRKLDALEDLIEAANGKPLLVAYWFKHDRGRIMKRFPVRDINTAKDMKDWNEGKIPVALIHPASAGHGLNLQEGGSTIIWFSNIWPLELYQQLNARLWRQGQKHTVVIEHLVTKGTIDEDILLSLEKKDDMQEAMIAAVKVRIGGGKDEGRSDV